MRAYLGATTKGNNEADTGTNWPTKLKAVEYDGSQGGDSLWGLGASGDNLTPANFRDADSASGFGIGV